MRKRFRALKVTKSMKKNFACLLYITHTQVPHILGFLSGILMKDVILTSCALHVQGIVLWIACRHSV